MTCKHWSLQPGRTRITILIAIKEPLETKLYTTQVPLNTLQRTMSIATHWSPTNSKIELYSKYQILNNVFVVYVSKPWLCGCVNSMVGKVLVRLPVLALFSFKKFSVTSLPLHNPFVISFSQWVKVISHLKAFTQANLRDTNCDTITVILCVFQQVCVMNTTCVTKKDHCIM